MRTAVVIGGSSGAGKTTTVRLLREVAKLDGRLASRLAFPRRFTTRASRREEDLEESRPVSRPEFQQMVHQGQIDVVWERPMPGAWDEPELYGFAAHQCPVAVLSANNALLRNPEAVAAAYDAMRIVVVEAPAEVRLKRLLARSPEMPAAEVQQRVLDEGVDIRAKADVVISTRTDDFLAVASRVLWALSGLIRRK